MRYLFLVGALGATMTVPCVGQTACAIGASACRPLENGEYKSVFEQLKGAADGTNQQFQMSATPDPAFPLHIFRNGIELTTASYSVETTDVTIRQQPVASAGDVYQAAYVTHVSASTRAVKIKRAVSVKPSAPIVSEYLSRSLNEELAQLSAGEQTADSASPQTLDRRVHTRIAPERREAEVVTDRQPESLIMLSRAIRRPLPNSGRGLKKTRKLAESDAAGANGLEGTGDGLIDSPFDYLNMQPNRLSKTLDAIDANDMRSLGTQKQAPQPLASFRMLSDSLDGKQ